MAGLLTHLTVSFGGIVFAWIFFEWKYGVAFGVGHLAPDLFDFGITGILNGTLNPNVIMTYPLFHTLAAIGHSFVNWGILGVVVLGGLYGLLRFNKISKKTLTFLAIGLAAVLLGVLTHIVLDVLIIETNHWI